MDYIYKPNDDIDVGGDIYYPGFATKSPVDSYEVHCGQSQVIEVLSGDLLNLTNCDGATEVKILAFDSQGQDAMAMTSLAALPPCEWQADAVAIHANQIGEVELTRLTARAVFAANGEAGEVYTIKSDAALSLLIAVEQTNDAIEVGGGGSILVEHSVSEPQAHALPKPLAPDFKDLRVSKGTAQAYRVKAGQYVQIIDVEGRQCSDFMAVKQSALDAGLERYIDSTVTRTMVGNAYPLPGLCDKFYDQDMQPLLAVVQDTVGRHDTFALACTARGYEDKGFPCHVNCSDNISNAYLPYGIKPREAWPAINFFFNSSIDNHTHHLSSQESWSRPGDYVVMQALTDLICVSTACPDDIDPINGWCPTDIHVRIYDQDSDIPKAIAHRPFTESNYNMTTESAFHPRTSELTNHFAVARDLWLPVSYEGTGTIEEYWACSQAVTIQDMSSLRKYDVMGPDAEALLQLAMTRNISKLAVHRGMYTLLCSEIGTVIDDGTLFRLSDHLFRWCCGSEESARQLKALAEQHQFKVWIKPLWSSMPNLAIQGPKSRDLLKKLIFTQPNHPHIDNIKWFGFTIGRLYDRNGPMFMLTRSGFTGELGYEIFCDQASALDIWDALMKEGEEFGITPMGAQALNIKRLEAGLMVANQEFTAHVDAFEAGLGFAVDLKKDHFIGKEALARSAESPRKVLVGLRLQGNEVPHHGAPIFVGRSQVGTITSAVRSPELDCVIAMAHMAIDYSANETQVEVGCLDGYMKRQLAQVCSVPFIDPKRERARA